MVELTVLLKRSVKDAFYIIPCHRKPERCFHVKGKAMPICSRCLSILVGYLFIPLLFFVHIPIWVGVVLQLPMLVDGYTQLQGWRLSNNMLRTMTGLISGFGLSVGIVAAVRILV